jgi:glutaredoxin
MAPKESLILYTRPDCHLCELAAAMLDAAGLAWRPADIESSADLEEEYGVRVPVVRRADTGRELDFPFDEEALTRFAVQ